MKSKVTLIYKLIEWIKMQVRDHFQQQKLLFLLDLEDSYYY